MSKIGCPSDNSLLIFLGLLMLYSLWNSSFQGLTDTSGRSFLRLLTFLSWTKLLMYWLTCSSSRKYPFVLDKTEWVWNTSFDLGIPFLFFTNKGEISWKCCIPKLIKSTATLSSQSLVSRSVYRCSDRVRISVKISVFMNFSMSFAKYSVSWCQIIFSETRPSLSASVGRVG